MMTLRPFLLLLLALLSLAARADERILDFHSLITVYSDGAMSVSETIKVRAEGDQIRRGIYRDFPTDYMDRHGNRVRVAFDVMEVLRDGKSEPFHTRREGNGVRVYIGREDHYLSAGEYTYTLTYRTDRQLGFFADHDELYWNVTGNGWAFPIDHASAEVHLPPTLASHPIVVEAYTGYSGSKGRSYRAETGTASTWFETTRPLAASEGLTIVASWPKGHVQEPTREERLGYLLQDNRDLLAAVIGLLLLTAYYLLVWHHYGRDPEAGAVMPHYEPPVGFSPASMRFIHRMGYDHKTFATAVIGLAVKGLITIAEENGDYTLQRTAKEAADLAPGEQALLKKLFHNGHSVKLEKKNYKTVGGAVEAHKEALRRNYQKTFFVTNSGWVVPGVLLTLLTLVFTVVLSPVQENTAVTLFMMVWLSGWTAGVVTLLISTVQAWRSARSFLRYGHALTMTLFSLPFLFFEAVGLGILIEVASLWLVTVLLAAIGLNGVFFHLLKAPTRAGRALLDKMEGFRLYLDVAEKDELQFRHPPDKTPALFERYLPYAMALDVEQRWAERFADVFANLEREPQPYRPTWYSGSYFAPGRLGGFTASLGGALSSAISSSSTAPGSSSGSGGGGSSGGGGGGGGGGGW